MTDVHSHILPFVDDGSDSVEKSLQLVKSLAEQGVKRVICTPHFKKTVYEKGTSQIIKIFNEFYERVKSEGIEIELYLGQEVFCNKEIYNLLKEDKVLTVNNSKYILLEFDYFNYQDIEDYVYNVKTMGYIPIIAHIERYKYLNVNTLVNLSNMGSLIQVNAASITGGYGKDFQKKVFATIKSGLVDFVATDCHYGRQASLSEAYKIVKKRFGLDVAERLFKTNAQILFN